MYDNDAARLIRQKCSLIGVGVTPGRLFDLGSYPGIVYEPNSKTIVYGELYKIESDEDELVQYLDRFEECGPEFDQPNEYRREIIPVSVDGTIYQASAYLYNRNLNGLKLIASGRYQDHQGHR